MVGVVWVYQALSRCVKGGELCTEGAAILCF